MISFTIQRRPSVFLNPVNVVISYSNSRRPLIPPWLNVSLPGVHRTVGSLSYDFLPTLSGPAPETGLFIKPPGNTPPAPRHIPPTLQVALWRSHLLSPLRPCPESWKASMYLYVPSTVHRAWHIADTDYICGINNKYMIKST